MPVHEYEPVMESTPEKDEEFDRIEARLNPVPESPLVDYGRNIERLGRLLQDTSVPMQELVAAANMAGFNLQFRIQPSVEDATRG